MYKFEPGYTLGNSSHPGLVIHAAAQIAAIKNVDLESVLEATTNNAVHLYRLQSLVNPVLKIEVFEELNKGEVSFQEEEERSQEEDKNSHAAPISKLSPVTICPTFVTYSSRGSEHFP